MAVRQNRLHKWLIGGPPFAYLLVFFAIPVLIMVLASFRFPGEFGGLAPLVEEGTGAWNLTGESYGRVLSDFL
jgi:spermidine/putrescine transport system permease protein